MFNHVNEPFPLYVKYMNTEYLHSSDKYFVLVKVHTIDLKNVFKVLSRMFSRNCPKDKQFFF